MAAKGRFNLRHRRIERLCVAAIELSNVQDFDSAAAKLRKAETLLKPDDTELLGDISNLYSQNLYLHDEAFRMLQPLVDANEPRALMWASHIYLDKRDPEPAIDLLKKAVEFSRPETAIATDYLGRAYLDAADYPQSARWYEKASASGDPMSHGLAVASQLLSQPINEVSDLNSEERAELQRLAGVGRSLASQRSFLTIAEFLILTDVGLNKWHEEGDNWLAKKLPLTEAHSIMLSLHAAANFYFEVGEADKAEKAFREVQRIAEYIRHHLPSDDSRRDLLIAGCLNSLSVASSFFLRQAKWEKWDDCVKEALAAYELSSQNHPLTEKARAAVATHQVRGVLAAVKAGAGELYDLDELWKDINPTLTAAIEGIELADTEHDPLLAECRANYLSTQLKLGSQRPSSQEETFDAMTVSVARLARQIGYCGPGTVPEFTEALRDGATFVEQHRPGTGQKMQDQGELWP